ncbi:aquaporin [Streptomyces sioyaensis]|uniref:aquaporin n=1 Tax=Streptomyces sioyaensis TaxID=67364 RepID=UPI0013874772|nr:aquaporin [Streptomyces sioyaensis]
MRAELRALPGRENGTASGGGTVAAGRHAARREIAWAAAAVEFTLTGAVLFVVVTAVRWTMASPFSRALPNVHLQLVVVAVLVGAALSLALSSRWGRLSGGHLNPAVTLALWLAGAFPGRNVLPYAVAQLGGSLAGTGLARLVWGPAVGGRLAYAAVRPGPGWSAAALCAAEAAATAAVIAVALFLLSRPPLTKWVPLALPAAAATVIVVLGTLTGGSANPARQFGPAIWAGRPAYLWAYLLAPLAGAALTALATRRCTLGRRRRCPPTRADVGASGSSPPPPPARKPPCQPPTASPPTRPSRPGSMPTPPSRGVQPDTVATDDGEKTTR